MKKCASCKNSKVLCGNCGREQITLSREEAVELLVQIDKASKITKQGKRVAQKLANKIKSFEN